MKYYFCYQLYDDDCGFACLKMLLACINNDKNYLFLPNYKEKGNYSFLELVSIAKKYNLFLKGYECFDLSKIKYPCIALIEGINNNHYVLITKIGKNYLCYIDPTSGKKVSSKRCFLKTFKGKYLCISEYIKTKSVFKINKRIPCIPLLLILICELIFLVSNMFLYSNSLYFFISIISVFVIQFISNRIVRQYALNLMNKTCIGHNIKFDDYSKVTLMISKYVSSYICIYEKVFSALNLMVIFSRNLTLINYLIFLIVLIGHYFYYRYNLKKERYLSVIEKQIFANSKNNIDEYFEKIKKHLNLSDFYEVLFYLGYCLLLIIIELVSNKLSINSLFSLILGLFVVNKVIEISKSIYIYKKRNTYLNQVINILNEK